MAAVENPDRGGRSPRANGETDSVQVERRPPGAAAHQARTPIPDMV